ncbi:MAG: hypothetical protein WCL07_04890 [bacterium]
MKKTEFGYSTSQLTIDKTNLLRLEGKYIVMKAGELEHLAPGSELRLLTPKRRIDKAKLDGALIKITNHTPVQEFFGDRVFVESTTDEMIWVGRSPSGETITYNPNEIFSFNKKKTPGHISYGKGWVGSWINMGQSAGTLLEICIPPFAEGGIVEHEIDDPAIDLMFWKVWHAVANNI